MRTNPLLKPTPSMRVYVQDVHGALTVWLIDHRHVEDDIRPRDVVGMITVGRWGSVFNAAADRGFGPLLYDLAATLAGAPLHPSAQRTSFAVDFWTKRGGRPVAPLSPEEFEDKYGMSLAALTGASVPARLPLGAYWDDVYEPALAASKRGGPRPLTPREMLTRANPLARVPHGVRVSVGHPLSVVVLEPGSTAPFRTENVLAMMDTKVLANRTIEVWVAAAEDGYGPFLYDLVAYIGEGLGYGPLTPSGEQSAEAERFWERRGVRAAMTREEFRAFYGIDPERFDMVRSAAEKRSAAHVGAAYFKLMFEKGKNEAGRKIGAKKYLSALRRTLSSRTLPNALALVVSPDRRFYLLVDSSEEAPGNIVAGGIVRWTGAEASVGAIGPLWIERLLTSLIQAHGQREKGGQVVAWSDNVRPHEAMQGYEITNDCGQTPHSIIKRGTLLTDTYFDEDGQPRFRWALDFLDEPDNVIVNRRKR